MKILGVESLSRRHGALLAVDAVSFDIAEGEIFGLLGPNGSGKTTTVECILGLQRPDSGRVTVCGIDAAAHAADVRARIGAVLQETGLQDKITPREAIRLFACLSAPGDDHRKRSNALLKQFGLEDKADAAFVSLSGGQKQRLALALAFAGDPALVVLDEPSAGLDVQMRRELHDHIRAFRRQGRAVLLTTHDMEEAAALCDRIAVLADGRIVAEGAPQALIAAARAASLEDAILEWTKA